MWSFVLLILLIGFGFGVAFYMARKIKAQIVNAGNIDLEQFALKIAKAVAKEVAEELLDKIPATQGYSPRISLSEDPEERINIDESIIPINLDISAVKDSNLKDKMKEEKSVDSRLEKSKTKLASIMKKKRK